MFGLLASSDNNREGGAMEGKEGGGEGRERRVAGRWGTAIQVPPKTGVGVKLGPHFGEQVGKT